MVTLLMGVDVGLPCSYTAVKCGSSGHNIRVATDLDSTAVGMVVVGNQLTATRQVLHGLGLGLGLGLGH